MVLLGLVCSGLLAVALEQAALMCYIVLDPRELTPFEGHYLYFLTTQNSVPSVRSARNMSSHARNSSSVISVSGLLSCATMIFIVSPNGNGRTPRRVPAHSGLRPVLVVAVLDHLGVGRIAADHRQSLVREQVDRRSGVAGDADERRLEATEAQRRPPVPARAPPQAARVRPLFRDNLVLDEVTDRADLGLAVRALDQGLGAQVLLVRTEELDLADVLVVLAEVLLVLLGEPTEREVRTRLLLVEEERRADLVRELCGGLALLLAPLHDLLDVLVRVERECQLPLNLQVVGVFDLSHGFSFVSC